MHDRRHDFLTTKFSKKFNLKSECGNLLIQWLVETILENNKFYRMLKRIFYAEFPVFKIARKKDELQQFLLLNFRM
jgi:hypothetical protein